jgi:hypothetical protein
LLRSVHPAQHHRFLLLEGCCLKSVAKVEYHHCQKTTMLSRGILQQRGDARNAALCWRGAARCGSAYQASPLWFYRRPVETGLLATAEYRYRQKTAMLSRGFGPQRGHVPPPFAALLWPPRLTAGLLLGGYGFGRLPRHTSSADLSNNAVRHSGQSLRSCQRHITAFGLPAGWPQSVCEALVRHAQVQRGTSPVLRKCQSVTTARPCGVR